jgi:glucokinase
MSFPVVLGIDFGGSKIAAAVADPGGALLGHQAIAVDPGDSAARTFRRGIDLARAVLADAAPLDALAAVGACTFGIPHDDRIDLAPTIAGWERIAFGHELRQAFPDVAISTATDVKAAAQAEAEQGALRGCDPGLYVNLGTGLAVALVVGGAVVSGCHRAAGEIGYSLRRPGTAYAATDRLEDAVSGGALEAAAIELFGAPDVVRLVEHAETDTRATRIRDEFLTELCFHLVNLAIALDPERVAVGGGLVRSWDWLQPTLADALGSAVPFPPDLVVADHPFDAPLLGALALGRSAVRDVPGVRDVINEGAPT